MHANEYSSTFVFRDASTHPGQARRRQSVGLDAVRSSDFSRHPL